MRTLAIGDIHGCYRSLIALEAFVNFQNDDRIVTLGDYVDRGPNSKGVLEWLIHRHKIGNLVALRGNHELMMLAARKSVHHFDEWVASGGSAVFASYGANILSAIPTEHWNFLNTELRSHFITKTHFFVHANAYPDIALDEQPDYMRYWEPLRDSAPHASGLTMVCGHTPQRDGIPLNLGYAVCIDTWACGQGWLTCLDVDTGYCWQANEQKKIRSFLLKEGPY